MKDRNKIRIQKRNRRHIHIKKKVKGTQECPRIAVHRSLQQTYAQLVDDLNGKTLLSVSSQSPVVREQAGKEKEKVTKTKISYLVGETLAAQAVAQGIKRVVFDRSGYLYHGRVKALAEGARKGGLRF